MVFGKVAFDQGDRLAEYRYVAGKYPCDIVIDGKVSGLFAPEIWADHRRFLDSLIYGQSTFGMGLFMMIFEMVHNSDCSDSANIVKAERKTGTCSQFSRGAGGFG